MNSVNVDLGKKGVRRRRRKTGLCGGNWSETPTPHRSRKSCDERSECDIRKDVQRKRDRDIYVMMQLYVFRIIVCVFPW